MASTSTAAKNAALEPGQQDILRGMIQASRIIEILHDHVEGTTKLSAAQVRSAEVLLDRALPKLSQTQLTGAGGGAIPFTGTVNVIIGNA
jgi:hypothetical protein